MSEQEAFLKAGFTQAKTPAAWTPIVLLVVTGQHVPSKKNHHFPLSNGGVGIDQAVKEKMHRLERAIELGLYSYVQMIENGTASGCLKQLQTHLSKLSDDSVREIPEFSFGVRYVEPGLEGVEIEIEKL